VDSAKGGTRCLYIYIYIYIYILIIYVFNFYIFDFYPNFYPARSRSDLANSKALTEIQDHGQIRTIGSDQSDNGACRCDRNS
jgi:hypothetical protein